jgi:alkylation response protein AidB-like acyl-CoA dehydrogenase
VTDDEIRAAAQAVAREFGRDYAREGAAKGEFPRDLWQALSDRGLLSLAVPQRWGGSGLATRQNMILIETLAAAGVASLFLVIVLVSQLPILRHGTEDQVRRFVSPVLSGAALPCVAITEDEAGTNVLATATSATNVGDGWTLRGEKHLVTAADVSDYVVVLARTQEPSPGDTLSGFSVLLVDPASRGVELTAIDSVLEGPERYFRVRFDDVRVEADRVLGEPGAGLRYLFDTMNTERLLVAAMSVGLGDYVVRRGASYAMDRAPFGRPLGSYQSVQRPLANAHIYLQAGRRLAYEAAAIFDLGADIGQAAGVAKYVASEACMEAVNGLVAVSGGRAFDRSQDVMSLLHTAWLMRIGPVANEMVLGSVAAHDLGLPKAYF